MEDIRTIAIDISKQTFELAEKSEKGQIKRKKLYRSEMIEYFSNQESSLVIMESGGGAHYWGRKLKELGHEVKLIAPQFVKPFVRSNKNDRVDAVAILVAATSPEMRFVSVKSIEQQELQHLHRVRERLMKSRTATNNELRGVLLEYGAVIPKGKKGLSEVHAALEKFEKEMTPFGREIVLQVLSQVHRYDEELKAIDQRIESISSNHPVCCRLKTIPGVGPIIATAIVASVSDPSLYKNGRQFSASLGLVPKHTGTGGKNRTLGISKRGDCYIRKQLIHGSRSLLYRAHLKTDKLSCWATNLKQSRGWNRASVALANKNARIIWALLRYEKDYSPIPVNA